MSQADKVVDFFFGEVESSGFLTLVKVKIVSTREASIGNIK
jgi:hypothetical protein